MGILRQVLISYVLYMKRTLCLLKFCHARQFRENIFSVTVNV